MFHANSAVDATMQDSLVRDLVRQEANLTLQQDNLTTQQDTVAPDTVEIPQEVQTFHWSQPTFDQVIGRWYKISNPTWSYLTPADTSVLTLDISKALFNITTLFDRVKRFRYWRGGVKVRIQANSTAFHYGTLFAAIVPFYSTAEEAAEPIGPEVWELSGQKCSGYLSANTGKPLELSCPFQSPTEYQLITQLTAQRPFYLTVSVMNPLKISGGASSPVLSLSVFAQFTDLEIMGPSEITANSSSKKVTKADSEQRNANRQGTLGKVAGAVTDIASKLTSVPVVGSIASAVAPVASAIGGIFDYFGWDKPTNISSQIFTINRFARGMEHSSGQDPAEPVGLKPDQKISTETVHYGAPDEATRSFLKLIQTPMWNSRFTIAAAQAVDSVFQNIKIRPFAPYVVTNGPPVTQETQRHDYLSYYSQFFRACRGGYKYYLLFDTSSYTTARVRVTFEPSNINVPTVTDGGDSFSRIIDVNGATCVVFEVPYCYPSARMPIQQTTISGTPMNGQLLFSLVNPVQSNGSSADVIYVNVFRAAADDFRFYQPHRITFAQTYVPSQQSQSSASKIYANSLVEQLSSQVVTTLGDGPKVLFDRITEDEEVVAHNDFLHRYHYIQQADAPVINLRPLTGDPFYWMSPFRSYRGAIRMLANASFTMDGLALSGSPDGEDVLSSGAVFNNLTPEDIPVELPYNNNVRFLPLRMDATSYPDAYNRYAYFSGTYPQSVVWSAGDDFTLGLRKAPRKVLIAVT